MSEWGFFIFLGIMAGWDGTLALTSHSIAYSYLTILFNIPLSISAVISIQISKHLGENNLKLCRSTGINGIAFCSSIMFVISIFLYLFRLYFPLVFTDDYSTIELTSTILIFMSPVLLFDSMQCLMMGILRGMQDTKRPTIYAFISYWVIGIPIIYFFTKIFQFKVLGIWMGLLITLILISVSLFYRLSKVFNFQKQIDNVQIKTQPSD
jgi:MATE family multidrug resistance protein